MIEEIIQKNHKLAKNKEEIKTISEYTLILQSYWQTEKQAHQALASLNKFRSSNYYRVRNEKPKILIPKSYENSPEYFKLLSETLDKLEDKIDNWTEKQSIENNIDSTEYTNELKLYYKFLKKTKTNFIDTEEISRIEPFSNNPKKYFLRKKYWDSEDTLDKIHYKIIPKALMYATAIITTIIDLPIKTYKKLTNNKVTKAIDNWTNKKLDPYKVTQSGTMNELINNK